MASVTSDCRVVFGRAEAEILARGEQRQLGLALPVLAGDSDEVLLTGAEEVESTSGCTLFRRQSLLAGFAVAQPHQPLEAAASDLYRRVFAVTSGLHLYRIWNYVPRINEQLDGLENYRHFCRGRSLAFESHFGAGFKRHLPAASAVGSEAGPLAVAFLAGANAPQHFENPRQVPAFEYPVQYGPRPPSFARATAQVDQGRRRIYVSGTAAIRGHATVAAGDLAGQLVCMGENLQLIAEAAGAGRGFGGAGCRRSFKAYLRRKADLPEVMAWLDRNLVQPGDSVQYLQGDICRSDLLVELEAVIAPL